MKAVLVLFAVISVGTAGQVGKDIASLASLVPIERYLVIALDHLITDEELAKAENYIYTKEFKSHWSKALKSSEFVAIMNYVKDSGLNFAPILNAFADVLEFDKYAGRRKRSVESFVQAIIDALPKDKVKAAIKERVNNSPDFKNFFNRLTSSDFDNLVQKFLKAPSLAASWRDLKNNGIDGPRIYGLVMRYVDDIKKAV